MAPTIALTLAKVPQLFIIITIITIKSSIYFISCLLVYTELLELEEFLCQCGGWVSGSTHSSDNQFYS